MGLFSRSDAALAIGIDLGGGSLKMVQVAESDGRLSIVALAEAIVPAHLQHDEVGRLRFYGDQIATLVASSGFRGRRCALGLPGPSTFIRPFRLGASEEPALTQAVAQLAGRELPYPADKAVIRHLVTGPVFENNQRRTEVIVVAALMSTIEAYIEIAERAKLEIVGIYPSTLAVSDCFRRLFRRDYDPKTVAIIDVGHFNTSVVIAHSGSIAFARSLLKGGSNLQRDGAPAGVEGPRSGEGATQEALLSSDEWLGQLLPEVEQCLRYHEASHPEWTIERLVICGGITQRKDLCQEIARRLSLPAQLGDPLAGVKRESAGATELTNTDGSRGKLSVAVGLSLWSREADKL